MTDVTATDLKNVINASESATELEYVMDLAIDALNIFGAELSNLTGTAGTKKVDLTSKQRGGVFIIARQIYQKFYKSAGTNVSFNVWSLTAVDILKDTELADLCEKIGEKLASTSEGVSFNIGEDTSGID